MSIGVWTPQGTVIAGPPNAVNGNPNVLYESGALILSPNPDGKIWKMWYADNGNGTTTRGVYYAESADHLTWTPYGSNPVIGGVGGLGFPKTFHVGSTYYGYITNGNGASISVYTSSDGVAWSLAKATAIAIDQAWETTVWELTLVDIVAGIWYAYYTGGAPNWYMGSCHLSRWH